MKPNLIASLVLAICFFTVGGPVSAQTKLKTVKKNIAVVARPPVATAQEIEDAKALIAKSDCLACHHLENKLVGPTYNSVAEKYVLNEANVTTLSQKIISGGSGVWGTVPMPPHATLSASDAAKMVKYILSLNQKNATAIKN